MMSADNQNMDLGLALGYSTNCTRLRVNENSGAGVNAGSSVNLKFPASDSLSELVWSPQRGLSLKCTEGSFPDKKAFLLWNVDPSPAQSIGCEGSDYDNDDKVVAGNLVISNDELHLDSEVALRSNMTESTAVVGASSSLNLESKDVLEGGKTAEGVPHVSEKTQNVHHVGGDEKEVYDVTNQEQDYVPESSNNDACLRVNNRSVQAPPYPDCDMVEAESSSMNLNKEMPSDLNITSDNAITPYRTLEEDTSAAEAYTNKLSEAFISPVQTLPWLDIPTKEVRAANEERRKHEFSTHGYMVPSGEKLEYTAENDLDHTNDKDVYDQNEGIALRGCSLPLDTDAENQSIHFHRSKGKNKALSEGNSSKRLLDNEDDSQESLESCNSAGLLGKKRLNLNEQFMVESKRMKKDMEGDVASTSMVRHSSSFMNWLSNVVSGGSKSNHEDRPSLALTLAHSSHEDRSPIQDNVVCSKLQESNSENTGFQTLFQSLYCSNTKVLKAGASENDCYAGRTLALMQVDNTVFHPSPNRFFEPNGVSCDHNFTSDEKIIPSTREDIVSRSDQALVLYRNAPTWNDFKSGSPENKESRDQECSKYVNGTNASISQSDHNIAVRDDGNPPVALNERITGQLSNKGSMLGNLWITRFTTKVCNTSLNLHCSSKEDHLADDCAAPNLQTLISEDFPIKEKCSDTKKKSDVDLLGKCKELQTFAADTEPSIDSKKMQEHEHQNVVVKLSSTSPSHKSRTSDAMASTFARRFNALRYITPTVEETDTSSRLPTSFSSGKSEHNLQTCTKVTESKLVEVGSTNQKFCFVKKGGNFNAAAWNGEKTRINASHELPVKEFSGSRSFSSNETLKQIKSNFREDKTCNHQNLPSIDLITVDIGEIPEGVFDAVRRLQLSRADMIKWISSNASLSHLDGLFLRLRLGKLEAGLGGTGYHVARITVERSEGSLKDCEKAISVNVGGMNCSVGCKYISNHDFLEEELKVWWCRILRSGGKVPCKEDLDSRFKQRTTLGL